MKKVDWDSYEFRCSSLGQLMTNTRGKSNIDKYNELVQKQSALYEKIESSSGKTRDNALEKYFKNEDILKELKSIKDEPLLSDTCRRRLSEIYSHETSGRVKDVKSMAIEKGLKVEEDVITLYSSLFNKMYRKNKERVSNGFITGEIDFEDKEQCMVIDTKASFDIFTFDATASVDMNKNYYWQGQGYMWLKGASKFRLAYGLVNTPKEIVSRMIKNLMYSFIGSEDELKEYEEQIIKNHNFDDIPESRRMRIYETSLNEDSIEMIKSRVPMWRKYLNNYERNNIIYGLNPED